MVWVVACSEAPTAQDASGGHMLVLMRPPFRWADEITKCALLCVPVSHAMPMVPCSVHTIVNRM